MQHLTRLMYLCVSLVVTPPQPVSRRRDQRGLSQSTENAILLAGAVAVAALIIKVITGYVKTRLPK